MELISSLQNPHIKQAYMLTIKARERRMQNLFVIEGRRELELAVRTDYVLETLFVCRHIYNVSLPLPICKKTFEIAPSVFEKLAYRTNSDGILATAQQKRHNLTSLNLCNNPFIIVTESIEKPGNMGAILRTADAAGVDAVMVCSAQCDLYNPNTVRASIGALFTNRIAFGEPSEILDFLTKNNIQIIAADLQANTCYYDFDMRPPTAIVFGSESDGLSDFWLRNAHCHIKIPMIGKIDSLNVSVSAAVLTFEAIRQRKK